MIVVTGCAGFIGSHLSEELIRRGNIVIGIDNFDPYYSKELKMKNLEWLNKQKNFKFHERSILSEQITGIVKGAETIYHLAAIAGVRNSIKNPLKYIETNVLGAARIFEAARISDVKKIVLASSSSVYGNVPPSELPVKESHALNPISPYGTSKKMAEETANMYSQLYGIKTAILRYFTVYGPRQRPDEALTKFISKALRGEVLEIYGDGTQTRDFTYIEDVVLGTILACEKGIGTYNVSGGKSITVNEVLALLKKATGMPMNMKHIEKQPGDVSDTLADISKAKTELGYSPKISLEEGIKVQLEWLKTASIA